MRTSRRQVRSTSAGDTPCRSRPRPSCRRADRTRRRPARARRAPAPARRVAGTRYRPLTPASASTTNSAPSRIEREPLRPAEAGCSASSTVPSAIDAIERVVRRQRRAGDVQRAVGPEREMKRRDARRQRRERRRVAARDRPRRSCPSDRRRTACRRSRTPARRRRRDRWRTARRCRRPRRDRRCPRTGSTRTARRRGSIAIDVGLTMPDENVSRVPFGPTRKIETGTCWPRVPL